MAAKKAYIQAMKPISDSQWSKVAARRSDGPPFFIGVVTTGIFCRPDCPARMPKRENVVVFESAEEAGRHGFRPCLKCRPLGPDPVVQSVVAVARAIEADPAAPWETKALEAVAGIGIRALRRRFRDVLGTSPKAYRDAVRLRRFKDSLKEGQSVTEAGYDAGYSGPARRHAASKHLAMTPSTYAKGGAGETLDYVVTPTVLGSMLMAATDKGISVLHFLEEGEEATALLAAEYPAATLQPARRGDQLSAWAKQVAGFLKKGGVRPDLPVDLRGTAFQMKVWQALQEIPAGKTTTYGALAEKIGHPGASRAVGNANGKNPVPVIVPCHLVVASGGKLGGYTGGLDRKRHLLALETKTDLLP